MKRTLIPGGSPYEDIVGFSRAVRVGNHISVAGTAPIGKDGKTVGIGDPAAQAKQCYLLIKEALENAGSGLKDVVRSRIFLKRIEDWEEVAKVRTEFLKEVKPADTVIQVTSMIDPDWLVEIEADAILSE